jgi:glutaminyl-tRNA synthetase
MTTPSDTAPLDFVRQIIEGDIASGKHGGRVCTRFPPEPNGYLHIGHAKAICIDFGVAEEYAGTCFLRFDDTNPVREHQDFADAIMRDVRWLGFDWGDKLTHASDYFPALYEYAVSLIRRGHAYIDSLTAEEIREYRGTLTEPGRNSPYRDRSVEENLELFEAMRDGKHEDGTHVLRARIDMASPNMNLRDPTLYRIRNVPHQRTGDAWHIYPMYDFAHTLSDALEGITHSLCSLEFEDHRPLYEWLLDHLDLPNRPHQYEFSRLNLAYTITSKRKLAALIENNDVDGWDDPRMPTLAAMRRRGYPAAAIRDFCRRVGITKKENVIEMGVLENSVREALGDTAPRAMAVLDPLKLRIINYPDDREENVVASNHPGRPEMGTRELPFASELLIEQGDFMEDAPRKFFRLKPGGEVRLRYAYIIKCVDIVRDADGRVVEVLCTYDPETHSGSEGAARKVKGTIHWVTQRHSRRAQLRIYDRLFHKARPGAGGSDFRQDLNPKSLERLVDCRVETAVADSEPGTVYQFERTGYFVADAKDHKADAPIFNRIVSLRDSWAKIEKAELAGN